MEIRRVTRAEDVQAAGHLFESPPLPEATARFLADERHHLLVAYVDDAPAAMVTGVETTRPDRGTGMFLHELGVDARFSGRGIGPALTSALADLARDLGCSGMWVVTEADNPVARSVYRSAGGVAQAGPREVFVWSFDLFGDTGAAPA
ncbi:GNAT family N-acetyltransferase [Kitasatospora sp. NPDC058115]|uniref:GNAT family N-acetyltransferase n=1 Tax=Kitasatospora sp. NPDC058115 TaxID=3346347 RepID=UPI0036D9FAE2